MKISQININNFKSLKDVSLKLSDLTLLTGVNSSGKSSFIQSLLLLKQNQESLKTISHYKIFESTMKDNKLEKSVHASMETLIENSKKLTINLNGEYLELGQMKDILNQEVFNEDISVSLVMHEMKYKVSFSSVDSIINIDSEAPIEVVTNLFLDDFQYISTDRIPPRITYQLSESNIKKNLIGFQGEYTAHYLAENRRNDLNILGLKHPKSVTNQFLENTSLWLREISDGIDIEAKIYSELQQVNLTYSYIYGDNKSNNFTPLNVGFGITYVLPIIVAILKAKPDDLLIIENPESHLHPAAQSKIAELCALASSFGVQIIVETHSDHFLNGIRVATKNNVLKPENSQVYFFIKEDNTLETKVESLNIDKYGNINENWPKGFFDEYRNKLDELLW